MLDLECPPDKRHLLALARQEIEYLRRLYALATDALGKTDDGSARQFGIETYHRIFTDDVRARVTGAETPLSGTGPDAWVDVATHALTDYESTQHLIGTQVVTFNKIEFDGDAIVSGDATMSSYVHAWHARPERTVRLVIGTYTDRVRWQPEIGWQIFDMTLERTTTEHRPLGDES